MNRLKDSKDACSIDLAYPISNQLIGQEYQLLECCGKGEFATVWKVRRLSDSSLVALKILKHQADMEGALANEAGPLVGTIHPRLTSVSKVGHIGAFYYVEMEYFGGRALEELISAPSFGDETSLKDIIKWMIGVLEALDFMHSRRATHGDIKPGNIMLDSNTQAIKLTDFGASRYMTEDICSTRGIATTWVYQAPETIALCERRFNSDIYSVGAVLYHLATGRTPYQTIPEIVNRMPFPRPGELNGDIPELLEAVILKALSELPENRYQQPQAMAVNLKKCLKLLETSSEPIRSTPEERKMRYIFAQLADKLGFRCHDIPTQAVVAPSPATLMDDDPLLAPILAGDSHEMLSAFADIAYSLGYNNTAITAYQKLLDEIDNGIAHLDVRKVLTRLDELYTRQKKLPKWSNANDRHSISDN